MSVESNEHISTTIELATATRNRTHIRDSHVSQFKLYLTWTWRATTYLFTYDASASRAFDTCHTTGSFINSDSIIKLEFARTDAPLPPYQQVDVVEQGSPIVHDPRRCSRTHFQSFFRLFTVVRPTARNFTFR